MWWSAWAVVACGAVAAWAGAQPTTATTLDAAIEQLATEAKAILAEEHPPSIRPRFTRPHPVLRGLPEAEKAKVAEALDDRWTGDAALDIFVRHHLLWLAKEQMDAALEPWRRGEAETPAPDAALNRALVALLAAPSPELPGRRKPEEVFVVVGGDPADPAAVARGQELSNQREQLLAQTAVRVGVPPFDQTLRGRDALGQLTGAARQRADAIVKQADDLAKQFRQVRLPAPADYNNRRNSLGGVIRDHRNEVILLSMRTGEKRVLDRVIADIDSALSDNQYAAIELLGYFYLGVFDGLLPLFDERDREFAARDLERLARRSEGYQAFKSGGDVPPWSRQNPRSFGEYAFHAVQVLRDPLAATELARPAKVVRDDRVAVPKPREPVTSATLNGTLVQQAIDCAVLALNQPGTELALRPSFERTLTEEDYLGYLRRGAGSGSPAERQERNNEVGNQALLAWAQLAAGESFQHPVLLRRLHFVLSMDTTYTYDRSMRLRMLGQLPRSRFMPWVNRDALWLTNVITPEGGFLERHGLRGEPKGWGDHATGQYGFLGLWAAQQAGVDLNRSAVERVDKHWRFTQDRSTGGWALGHFNVPDNLRGQNFIAGRDPSVAMTAGGVAVLASTERVLRGADLADATSGLSPELRAGLTYLDRNFVVAPDDARRQGLLWTYYLWTVQQVGRSTGQRVFNDKDWFREGLVELLNRQSPTGIWRESPSGAGTFSAAPTGFGLLFLTAANDPVGFAKLRFGDPAAEQWNNRPHDLWNLSQYVTDTFERPQVWQIVTPTAPLETLLESPVLLMSTDRPFTLPDAEVARLRAYLHHGGTLVTNVDKFSLETNRSFAALFAQLVPGGELVDVPADHELRRIHRVVDLPMQMVSNGARPLVVHFPEDLGADLQRNRTDTEAFRALANVYLYAVGVERPRGRFENDYLATPPQAPSKTVPVALVKLGTGAAAEPAALAQLNAFMRNKHRVGLDVADVAPAALSARHKLAVVQATGDTAASESDAAALRAWVEAGGTLLIDAVGGTAPAADAGRALMTALFPDRPSDRVTSFDPLIAGGRGMPPTAHDLTRVSYRRFTTIRLQPPPSPQLQAVYLGERPAVIFSAEDLSAGMAGSRHWGILGYGVDSARQIAANVVLLAGQ